MCSLFRNKYRSESTRLISHDYLSKCDYFVTICTCRMTQYFGNVLEGKMALSEIGNIANKFWIELPEHFSFVSIDEFIVMPNHIHGILFLRPTLTFPPLVGTLHATSLHKGQSDQKILKVKNEHMSVISPKSESLANVIRSYKSAVSKQVHLVDSGFSWQPRYHDHIIRSYNELKNTRNYILNNPHDW
jgi:putative transposase